MDDGEETGSEALAIHGHRVSVIAVFLVIATLYVITLFVPDPSLQWAAGDEVCCHIPAIRAFQEQRLLETLLVLSERDNAAVSPPYGARIRSRRFRPAQDRMGCHHTRRRLPALPPRPQ